MIRPSLRSIRRAVGVWKALASVSRRNFTSKPPSLMEGLVGNLKIQQQLIGERNRQAQIVVEQKNDCLYIKDAKNEFGFMSEVETDQHGKGVVVDIRDRMVGIALYSPSDTINTIKPSNRSASEFDGQKFQLNSIYSVEEKQLFSSQGAAILSIPKKNAAGDISRTSYCRTKGQPHEPVPILNPLLGVCYNIKYGDFVVFEGPYGTGKSATVLDIARVFPSNDKSIVVYLSYSIKDCQKLADALIPHNINFLAFSEDEKTRSDAGGLLLALKTVNLAKRLRNQGYRVLTIIENINEVIRREVSMLKNFQQPIAPFSIVNELYCESGAPSSVGYGDLTTILTMVEDTDKNRVDGGYLARTPYVNSLSHIHSLVLPIKFPLELRINQNPRPIARHINHLLQLQKDYELRAKLKLNTEPWENYFLLDSKWWVTSLRKFKPASYNQLELFLQFVEWNIEKDYVAHWSKPAIDCFGFLKKWLQDHNIPHQALLLESEKSTGILQAFLMHCKIQGTFSPFASDYLS